MSWRNLEGNPGDPAAAELDWLPEISDYGIAGVVCVAGKDPDDDKICSFCMKVEGGGWLPKFGTGGDDRGQTR